MIKLSKETQEIRKINVTMETVAVRFLPAL